LITVSQNIIILVCFIANLYHLAVDEKFDIVLD